MQLLMTYAHKSPLDVHVPLQVKNLNLPNVLKSINTCDISVKLNDIRIETAVFYMALKRNMTVMTKRMDGRLAI